jgi:hypothetical protein
MAIGSEIDILHALTSPVSTDGSHSTAVLVEYLRSCGSASGYLCNGLADLLDEHGTSPLRLRLGHRDTRYIPSKENVERSYDAYLSVQELTGAIVTDALCQGILATLPGWTLKYQGQFCFQLNGIIEIRLRPGKPITKNMAIHIAAFQINKEFETVKKMIAAVEAANREA